MYLYLCVGREGVLCRSKARNRISFMVEEMHQKSKSKKRWVRSGSQGESIEGVNTDTFNPKKTVESLMHIHAHHRRPGTGFMNHPSFFLSFFLSPPLFFFFFLVRKAKKETGIEKNHRSKMSHPSANPTCTTNLVACENCAVPYALRCKFRVARSCPVRRNEAGPTERIQGVKEKEQKGWSWSRGYKRVRAWGGGLK